MVAQGEFVLKILRDFLCFNNAHLEPSSAFSIIVQSSKRNLDQNVFQNFCGLLMCRLSSVLYKNPSQEYAHVDSMIAYAWLADLLNYCHCINFVRTVMRCVPTHVCAQRNITLANQSKRNAQVPQNSTR